MTYTRAWDPPNMLLGTRDADEIDDAVRDFARDLDERMSDFLVDPTADPVQLATPAARVRLPWMAGQLNDGAAVGVPTFGSAYIHPTIGGTVELYFPIIVGAGTEFTEFEFSFLKVAAGSTITYVIAVVENDGTVTVIDTNGITTTDPAKQTLAVAVSRILLGDAFMYVKVVLVGDGVAAANTGLYSISYLANLKWGT